MHVYPILHYLSTIFGIVQIYDFQNIIVLGKVASKLPRLFMAAVRLIDKLSILHFSFYNHK